MLYMLKPLLPTRTGQCPYKSDTTGPEFCPTEPEMLPHPAEVPELL